MNCKQEIQHLRELRKLDLAAKDLQAIEYERRLEALNGEYKNIKDNQAKSVLREVHDVQMMEKDKKIQEILDWKNNMTGRIAIMFIGWGIIVAAVASFVSYVIQKK